MSSKKYVRRWCSPLSGAALAITAASLGVVAARTSADEVAAPPARWTSSRLIDHVDANLDTDAATAASLTSGGSPPDVDVTPTSISQVVSGITMTPLTIRNLGDPTLEWSQAEVGANSALLTQAYNGINGFNAGFYLGLMPPAGIYVADDVTPAQDAVLTRMTAEGFMTGPAFIPLSQLAQAVTFKVYVDAAGVPAGNPEAGANGEVYSCVRTPTGPDSAGLTFTETAPNAFVTLDIVVAAGTGCPPPPRLNAAQRYWISVFPTIPGDLNSTRWGNGLATTQSGQRAHRISPTGVIGTPTTWSPLMPVTPGTLPTLALRLFGAPPCGALFLDLAPDGDSLGAGAQTDAVVTLDATGLAPGTYHASICIDTEGTDPDEPLVIVPVTMVVPGDAVFADGFE